MASPIGNLIALALLGFTAAVPTLEKRACPSMKAAYTPVMGSGYTATVIANGMKAPREIIFDPLGNLLVLDQGGLGVRWVQITDNGGLDVCGATAKTIVSDSTLNHGMELTADGKTLFTSSIASVFAYDYNAATGAATNKRAVITGMTINGPYHLTRTLFIPKQNPDLLLVQRGSNGNIDSATVDATSGRSQVRIFKIADLLAGKAVDYSTNGDVLGFGLRNSVGWGQHPTTGDIWSVENSADDIKKNSVDIHTNNPAEELNYHGSINSTSNSLHGANYGYPNCFSVWDPTTLSGTIGMQTSIDLSVKKLSDADCAKIQAPKLVFPAHTAPIDIKFKKDGSAAYISFHGSWDRNPPDGYRVSKVLFKNGFPVEPSTSTSAAVNIMYNANNGACPNSCFRPAGLAWDSKDRLFMSSDSTGEIFIIGGT
ncbi:soluble quino protein glucose dehydrogenase [Mollisia scopiformis]|uniref:Soluble quino protein glucose dehydrogenase n=1 Tax=Mollisia scopiformis TaxID=149040 RepID=A0A194X4A5_MOLSC|nr:soluble quino protein glucose dehydrogenase [Mollisia scopiformis]KUJ15013.1 soluble quino protein glucose dehydrogenase [Mollisia scopiformis]